MACLKETYHVADKGGREFLSGYHFYVLGTLCLVTIISFVLSVYFKKRLTNMAGMVIAMTTGMNVGLTAGVFFGLLFQGNLYLSTIVSILVGVIAGTVCGFVMGILSTLEGFMAGLMGGMMGAMLGEMISQTQAVTIVNVFLTLSVSSLLLFQILPNPVEKEKGKFYNYWILKPVFTFIVIAGYLIMGQNIDKLFVQSKSIPQAEENHNNHSLIENTKSGAITINVHPSQFSYDPQKIILKKNQKVSLTLKNYDSIDHDIEIKKITLAKKNEGHHEGHSATEADFHLHASAKKQTEITFTPLQEGTFSFYCTLPGHKENGMTGILIIQ